MINIYLSSPRGFCAWVHRALNILNGALQKYGAPIFVNHEIIHNKLIVDYYKKKWVIFEEKLENIPKNSIMIFSAHWVSPKYIQKVKENWLKYIDASCPLVLKVHWEVKIYLKKWYKIIYIWQKNHQEALWVLWEWDNDIYIVSNKEDVDNIFWKLKNNKLVLLTQTTLSLSDKEKLEKYIFKKFSNIEKPPASDICFATTNRQNAVKKMIEITNIDSLIIVWSKNSSNSNKLKNIWEKAGIKSVLVDSFDDLENDFFEQVNNLWISSWASVSHELVIDVIEKIKQNHNWKLVEEINVAKENVDFSFDLEFK